MYPLTAGIVVQTKELWDELHASLQELPVRVVLEQSEVGQLSVLLEKIDRMRPEVIFVDISGSARAVGSGDSRHSIHLRRRPSFSR